MILADKTAQVAPLFHYSPGWRVHKFHQHISRDIAHKILKPADVADLLRQSLVVAMREGAQLVLDCHDFIPPFDRYFTAKDDDGEIVCPIDEVFDRELWLKDRYYMKIVNEYENNDRYGNKGEYKCMPGFGIIILSNCCVEETECEDLDEFLDMLLKKIPHVDKFEKYYIDELKKK